MIFGTDAIANPPAVNLPTETDQYFTNGNGQDVNGTQVPDYWVNKVGSEIEQAIDLLAGALGVSVTLSMTTRNQLGALLAALATACKSVAPQTAFQNVTLGAGQGANQTFSFELSFTVPCAGFVYAVTQMTYAQLPAAGAGPASGIVLSGTGVSNINNSGASGLPGDAGNPYPTGSFATASCAAGSTVTATFNVTTNATPPDCEFQQNGLLVFQPAY